LVPLLLLLLGIAADSIAIATASVAAAASVVTVAVDPNAADTAVIAPPTHSLAHPPTHTS